MYADKTLIGRCGNCLEGLVFVAHRKEIGRLLFPECNTCGAKGAQPFERQIDMRPLNASDRAEGRP